MAATLQVHRSQILSVIYLTHRFEDVILAKSLLTFTRLSICLKAGGIKLFDVKFCRVFGALSFSLTASGQSKCPD